MKSVGKIFQKSLEFEYISQVNPKEKDVVKITNEAGDVWISMKILLN